jgi:lipoate-protein ligase A
MLCQWIRGHGVVTAFRLPTYDIWFGWRGAGDKFRGSFERHCATKIIQPYTKLLYADLFFLADRLPVKKVVNVRLLFPPGTFELPFLVE